MPDFSVESWTSFKEQFMSVIRFILYCFDLFFDSVRSRPLLYVFFFFPIFAAALLILLSVVQRLFMTPESSDVALNRRGFGVLRLHGGKSDYKAIAVNLATTNHKLDSIDHKLGKVSTSAKLSSGRGSSAGIGKGAAVGTGKGASAGMGKGTSANEFNKLDHGVSLSHGIRRFMKDEVTKDKINSKKKEIKSDWRKYWSEMNAYFSDDLNAPDNSTSIGPQMYDDNTTLTEWLPYKGDGGKRIDEVNLDIDVDD